jgi:hypothetical protein
MAKHQRPHRRRSKLGTIFKAGRGSDNALARVKRVTYKIKDYPLVYRWQNIVEIVYKNRVEQFKMLRVDKNDRTIAEWEEFYENNGFKAVRDNMLEL